jgi:hypothetical protein
VEDAVPADIIGSEPPSPPPPRGERRRIALAALGGGLSVILLGAAALVVSSVARADTPSPSASGSTGDGSGATHAPAPRGTPSPGSTDGQGRPGWHRQGPRPGGFGGFGGFGSILGTGIGLGGTLHGTAVVKTRDGSYETVAGQRGTVTAVSATSISVKSEDGYQATYVVDKDTVVNGTEKITAVKQGDNVGVVATVDGGTSTATRVIDLDGLMATMQQFKDRFEHGPWGGKNGSPKASPSPSATSTA